MLLKNRVQFIMVLILLTSSLWGALNVNAQSRIIKSTDFVIKDIHVDKTANNAVIARKSALMLGKRDAFKKLARSIVDEEEFEYFELPEDLVINSLIQDFEIKDEQLSNVRYVASLTVRFKPEDVKRYFAGYDIRTLETTSPPVLILPFWTEIDGITKLWRAENPWKDAWSVAMSHGETVVPVVIPLGDIVDLGLANPDEILGGDFLPVKRLIQRYETDDVILTMASQNTEGLTVQIYEFVAGSLNEVKQFKMPLIENKIDFQAAVKEVKFYLKQRWIKHQSIAPVVAKFYKLRIDFAQMQDWLLIQKKIKTITGVKGLELISLRKRRAEIKIHYSGSEQKLRQVMALKGLSLSRQVRDFSAYMTGTSHQNAPIFEVRLSR